MSCKMGCGEDANMQSINEAFTKKPGKAGLLVRWAAPLGEVLGTLIWACCATMESANSWRTIQDVPRQVLRPRPRLTRP